MKSRWSDSEALAFVERYRAVGEDLALRVYTSRLIGGDPDLVLHGGGNTSVKTTAQDLLGESIAAIHVKGSGWDLGGIEPAGLPGLYLDRLVRLRRLAALTDEEMVNQLRTNLFDASAPTPSVETLLHAFLPAKFIDHSHADAFLALTDRTDGDRVVEEVLGDAVAIVPYVMPGFALARRAAEVADENPQKIGLALAKHGLFTWGETARESYERHIELIDRAEQWLAKNARRFLSWSAPKVVDRSAIERAETFAARIAPILRGRLAEATGDPDRPWRLLLLEHSASEEILEAVSSRELRALADSNPLTPDHVIRTKPRALVIDSVIEPAIEPSVGFEDEAWLEAIDRAVVQFVESYRAYVASGIESRGGRKPLDPFPRVIYVPGVGRFCLGLTSKDVRIAAEIADHTLRTKRKIFESGGDYEALPDLDLFDLEYWSLEQAKLGKGVQKPLAHQIAVVTGAAGAIGAGICTKLLEAGAHVALLDRDDAALARLRERLAMRFGEAAIEGVVCDVSDEASMARAFDLVCRRFGGVDLVVPNAGIAHSAPLDCLSLDDWRRVQEVNSTGVFLTLREAVRRLRAQGRGGSIVVISSKNVAAPGAEFGAYSASKAAAAQLAKVAALELAKDGIRVNSIAPDAVFGDAETPSGLWRDVGPDRAASRGMTLDELPDFYRQRSLLKVPLTARHIGEAVVFFASRLTPTTGSTLPVDGGLADAFSR